jgi:hypothetical protein
MWCGKMGCKAGRGEMRCYDVRGCNVRGRNRASNTTKVNAAAPEGHSATRPGYHRGRHDANQKNRCDANRKLSHNAELRALRACRGHSEVRTQHSMSRFDGGYLMPVIVPERGSG